MRRDIHNYWLHHISIVNSGSKILIFIQDEKTKRKRQNNDSI